MGVRCGGPSAHAGKARHRGKKEKEVIRVREKRHAPPRLPPTAPPSPARRRPPATSSPTRQRRRATTKCLRARVGAAAVARNCSGERQRRRARQRVRRTHARRARDDKVARGEPLDARAHGLDLAHALVAGHKRERRLAARAATRRRGAAAALSGGRNRGERAANRAHSEATLHAVQRFTRRARRSARRSGGEERSRWRRATNAPHAKPGHGRKVRRRDRRRDHAHAHGRRRQRPARAEAGGGARELARARGRQRRRRVRVGRLAAALTGRASPSPAAARRGSTRAPIAKRARCARSACWELANSCAETATRGHSKTRSPSARRVARRAAARRARGGAQAAQGPAAQGPTARLRGGLRAASQDIMPPLPQP